MIPFLIACGALLKDTPSDPAYRMASNLVGGRWVGKIGKLDVSFKFVFLEDGKMIEGKGAISDGKKVVVNMDSKFGWDPVAKQTYYLDCHGHDTVYNGHLTLKDGKMNIDFVGLIGDKGHWLSYAWFPDKDTYQFEMFEEKGGKMTPTHIGVKYHRVSD